MRKRWVFAIVVLSLAGIVAATFAGMWAVTAYTLRQPSWQPAAQSVNGLRMLASVTGEGEQARTALHTVHGDVTFWNGVNLGAAPPGHNPGEVAISRDTYRRWIHQMGDLRVHFLRIYTIHQPAFYEELRDYNTAHPDHPIYLIQGVYLPDESYLETEDLWAPAATAAFTAELRDASAAVSGDLTRAEQVGRASGEWTADISEWLAGWIIGVEWDPNATLASDVKNAGKPIYQGTYFGNPPQTPNVTPTEIWLAQRMDELAADEVARGRTMPLAFANWPTTDPLKHPSEPLESEDMVGVDANNVLATAAWPGGTFASYHAYPYYPDFMRYEPEYQKTQINGTTDAYAGYLLALKRHHAVRNLPLMVTEFGVPASIGSAHFGTIGRDQGAHTEQEAMATNADMLRMLHEIGVSGGLLFMWADEWFKFTWNTVNRQRVVDSERRALWHDPLTNEQWFGLIAQDPVPTGWRNTHEAKEGIRAVDVQTSPSFVELRITFDKAPQDPVRIEFSAAPGVITGASHAFVYDPAAQTLQAYVQASIDPIRLDGLKPGDIPVPGEGGWSPQRQTLNRPLVVAGVKNPAEFYDVGAMIEGDWNPDSRNYNSMATWHFKRDVLSMRIPWSMLGVADPSSLTGVVPDAKGEPVAVTIPEIPFTIDTGTGPQALGEIKWEAWQKAEATERLKTGWQALRLAFVETTRQ